jgi:hypothetical protein
VKQLPDLSGRVALRPAEAARAVGVSLNTLLAWRSDGLPIVARGRCLLVPVQELRAWLSRQIVPSGHELPPISAAKMQGQDVGAAEFNAGGPV